MSSKKGWRGPWKGLEVHPPVLKADLTQANPDRECDPLLRQDSSLKGKCFCGSNLNFFCRTSNVYFA